MFLTDSTEIRSYEYCVNMAAQYVMLAQVAVGVKFDADQADINLTRAATWTRKARAALAPGQRQAAGHCLTCGDTTAITMSVGDIEKVHTCPDCIDGISLYDVDL